MKKELLFSLTEKDFDFSYSHGTGCGGQARNKSLSAVHCRHKPSGAHAYSQNGRSQKDNKQVSDWLMIFRDQRILFYCEAAGMFKYFPKKNWEKLFSSYEINLFNNKLFFRKI